MQSGNEIFNFSDVVDYLNYEFEAKQRKNSRFSLRAWARQLGYENPSFLSQILNRQRSLKGDVAERFSSNLQIKGKEKKYFDLLVLFKNSKTVDEKKIYLDLLDSLRPKSHKGHYSLNIELFRVISDWHHSAILELVELAEFKNNATWIAHKLGGEVSIQNIEKAIKRLLNIELLEETPMGGLKRVKDNPILLEDSFRNEAIRHFHKQMIEKAKYAIEEQDVTERDLRGSTFTIRMKDYPKIQEILKKAHVEVVKYACEGDGEELYQFNTQFFRISKKKGSK